MKRLEIAALVVSIACMLLSAESLAQQGVNWRGARGRGMGSVYSRVFDPSTIDSISGEVVRTDPPNLLG